MFPGLMIMEQPHECSFEVPEKFKLCSPPL